MKIGIIGGGSIGLLLGSYLADKHDVTIYIRREEQLNALQAHGIIRSNATSNFHVESAFLNELSDEELLIVCVKQPHLSAVAKNIRKLNTKGTLVFLQNGMGHVPELQQFSQPVLLGVVEHGAYKENEYTVKHTGKGKIRLAAYKADENLLNTIVTQLSFPDFPVELVKDWERLLSEKLVINAVINPLTAIFDIKNGEVMTNFHIRNLAFQLCEEASQVLGLNHEEQWIKIGKVAHNTRDNISSMRKDLIENRQTEIEAISGYLLSGKLYSIPYTSFAYHSIKAMEEKKGIMKQR
ncbi:2-dehydropantoate 2-reductase [Virgibacillus kekensis]|uniref:2-dehydropantoate 2-reductase n=1 Tax=Virgibacillus kekensis TaxID=202261 RepID=A0ABV9DF34_9BACI